MRLGSNLKKELSKQNMSLSELSRKSGVPRSSISELVSGKHPNMRIDNVIKISKALNISLDKLVLGGKNG